MAIASEGAFGPHPALPLLPGGHELVLLLDRATGLELTGRDRTFDTNYMQRSVALLADAEAIASAIGFPRHGIILMSAGGAKPIDRDIATWPQLRAAVNARLEAEGAARIEADMRAHRNPLRMASIGRAAARLAASFGARCPGCRRPGWVPDREAGRPCGWCEGPTLDHWIERFACAGCALTETRTIDPARRAAPAWCVGCNP